MAHAETQLGSTVVVTVPRLHWEAIVTGRTGNLVKVTSAGGTFSVPTTAVMFVAPPPAGRESKNERLQRAKSLSW